MGRIFGRMTTEFATAGMNFIVAYVDARRYLRPLQNPLMETRLIGDENLKTASWLREPPAPSATWSYQNSTGPHIDFEISKASGVRKGEAFAVGSLEDAIEALADLNHQIDPIWSSVALPPAFTPDTGQFRFLIFHMLDDIESVVRRLHLESETESDVIRALNNWGDTIASLGSLDDPDEAGEVMAGAVGYRRSVLDMVGDGATEIAWGMHGILNNQTIHPYLATVWLAYMSGTGPFTPPA